MLNFNGILGPLLYTIFTNDLSEVILEVGGQQADHNDPIDQPWPAYDHGHEQEGNICCYEDDTALTCMDFSPNNLFSKLTNQYKVVAEYMVNNKLKLNDGKTNLVVMGSSEFKSRAHAANLVEIRTLRLSGQQAGRNFLGVR